MDNLNLLFNKEYYRYLGVNLDSTDPKVKCFHTRKLEQGESEKIKVIKGEADVVNSRITNTVFTQNDFRKCLIPDVFTLRMKTAYPGLLIGTGAPHGAGKAGGSDYDISCGFYFDYVTGQPYLPGSSVKGVLRSHFKNRPEAVSEIAKALGITLSKSLKETEKAVFENGVIFFDAVVCKGDKNGKMVGLDFITPHNSPTKEPVPIRIIKVMPDVQFEFRFKLNAGFDESIISAQDPEEKIKKLFELFKELLKLFGAGAKTNVGYGVLEEVN